MRSYRRIAIIAALAAALIVPAGVLAQTGGGYDLTWSSIDNGGAIVSTGGSYILAGTMGQFDVGPLTGGSYSLSGGFWFQQGYRIYLPMLMKG